MNTSANSTKPFPWKASARFIGAAISVLAKASWWLTKHGVVILGVICSFLLVVTKAIFEVFLSDDGDEDHREKNDSIYAEEGELGIDENDQTSFNGANRIKVL